MPPPLEHWDAPVVGTGGFADPVELLIGRAEVEVRVGRFRTARQLADEARRLVEPSSAPRLGAPLYALALAEAHLGLLDDAQGHARQGLATSVAVGDERYAAHNRRVIAFVAITLGIPSRVIEHLTPLRDASDRFGHQDPELISFYPDAVEAMLALDQLVAARYLTTELRGLGTTLEVEWGRAVGTRTAALVSAADQEWGSALEQAEWAVTLLRALPAPFELGRSLLVLGQLHQRRGLRRAARGALDEAVAIFYGLGCLRWAAKATEETERISGRPPRRLVLTET